MGFVINKCMIDQEKASIGCVLLIDVISSTNLVHLAYPGLVSQNKLSNYSIQRQR